jgi:hypothetical protein
MAGVAVVSMAGVEADSTAAALVEVGGITAAEGIVAAATSVAADIMAEAPTEVVRSEAPAVMHLGAGPRADSDAALAQVAATALAMGPRTATGIHLVALEVPRLLATQVDLIMPR